MNPSWLETPISIGSDETLDTWGNGAIRIIQKKTGYRFSFDAIILFQFVRIKDGHRVLDLGTGSGILALLLAGAYPHSRIFALELSSESVGLARRNVILNELQERISLIRGDLCRLPFSFKKGAFDTVVTNPPYRPLRTGRINPDPQKAMARHEIRLTLPDLLKAVTQGLKKGGKWFVIYPAWRLVTLLALSRQHRLEPKKIQLVHSFPGKEAEWVLMEAVYHGREELKVLPPLTVYQETGVYSQQVRKMGQIQKIGSFPWPPEPARELQDS